MSLVTPTTEELRDNIVANLEAALSQTVPLLPKAFTRVLAAALAAVLILVYRYAGFSFLQAFVAFATIEETEVNGTKLKPLVEWGRLFGVGDPIPAVQAELVVTVTVQNQVGDLPGGSQLLRADTGVIYQTVAAVLLDAPTVSVTIKATSDPTGGGAGVIGNLNVADIVSFANPLPNVATDAVVASTAVSGVDGETEEAYRGRILDRTTARPQGGALADYRVWGSEVAGVANIYPYTGSPGEVDVFVESTVALDPDGIAGAALLLAVFNAIELDVDGLASRRPANAGVNTISITRTAYEVVVSGLVPSDPTTLAATQTAISDALDEFLRGREPFIVGLSILPRLDRVTQGAVAGVVNEIANAEGATVAAVALKLDTVTITADTLGNGEKAKLLNGTATF